MARVRTAAFVLGLGLSVVAVPAQAADDPACIQAYEQTQALRKQSKLRDAREQAAKCARDTCPAVLARDCAKWFTEIEQSIPTVTFDARSPDGLELTNVKVTMDGKPLVDKVDGKSVPVDIGAHTFRFELVGDARVAPAERQAVVHEGDKNRKISVTFHFAAASARPVPASVWILGVASILGLGAGGFFAVKGLGQKGDLDDCKPNCAADKVNDVSKSYAFADVFLTAGVVTGVTAVILYLTRPVETTNPATNEQAHATTPLRVTPWGLQF